jgi:biopolymer transport protein ExbD
MAELNTASPNRNDQKKLKRPKRRISIRLDMTPMVDIAFLLLIFYMVTTVFAAPQAMQINLPEEGPPGDFPQSRLCVIRVDSAGNYWWTIGDRKGSSRMVAHADLLDSLLSANRRDMLLSTLIKIHPGADFSCYVDILDDISRVEKILQNDGEFVSKYIVKNTEELGVLSFTDTTFSYRYTTSAWHRPKDDIAIEPAKSRASASGERREP